MDGKQADNNKGVNTSWYDWRDHGQNVELSYLKILFIESVWHIFQVVFTTTPPPPVIGAERAQACCQSDQ